MLTALLDFLLKATRPLFFAAFFAAIVLYVVPDSVLLDWGFKSASAGRWTGVMMQIISTAVLLWPWFDGHWVESKAKASSQAEERGLRDKLRRLSGRARAALFMLGNSGEGSFTAEPSASHVIDLRTAGFISVDEIGEGWGRYNLTAIGFVVAHSSFEKYHSDLICSEADAEYVANSASAAVGNYRY